MNRQIKFRAWHEANKQMVYFDNNQLLRDHNIMHHFAGLLAGKYGDKLMQFTGLKDKNGVEIYEGDIVNESGMVMFALGRFVVVYGQKENEDLIGDQDEVIGNVFENPATP